MPVKCPTCGKPSVAPYSPFCAERCASVDLGNWFTGKYAFPAEEMPDESELDALIHEYDAEDGITSSKNANIHTDHGAEIMPFQRK